jgi:prevent-host-death family protein
MMKTEQVTTLKREATRLIAQIRRAKSPVLITQHGRPAAYLVDAESFEALQQRLRVLEGIARGERAVQEGRVLTHRQAKRRMSRWLA